MVSRVDGAQVMARVMNLDTESILVSQKIGVSIADRCDLLRRIDDVCGENFRLHRGVLQEAARRDLLHVDSIRGGYVETGKNIGTGVGSGIGFVVSCMLPNIEIASKIFQIAYRTIPIICGGVAGRAVGEEVGQLAAEKEKPNMEMAILGIWQQQVAWLGGSLAQVMMELGKKTRESETASTLEQRSLIGREIRQLNLMAEYFSNVLTEVNVFTATLLVR